MKIGYCGPGLMGAPMVLRLLRAGHELHIWNRTSAKLAPLVAAGAIAHASPAEVAAATDVVMLCLLNTDVVESVVFGANGVASGVDAQRGARVLVDHSSITPAATRGFAARLAATGRMQWVDAPVSGGVAGAEAGTLAIMAGGDAAVLDSVREVMLCYAARVTRMGPVGAGQATKLCNQTIVATTLLGIAEAVGIATRNGIDAAMLPEAFGGGWADSKVLQVFVPRMVHPPEQMIGALNTMLKDIEAAAELAAQSGAPTPVSAAALQMLRLAAANGFGEQDLSTVVNLLLPKKHA